MKIWNFAIIGSGMIAEFHARALNVIYNARLVAVYGRNEEKAKAFGKKNDCDAYHNLADMLQRDDIDLVTIATPSGAHLEPTLAAARAGKHIICEKPLEINVDRIQQMIKVCEEERVMLSGIFNRRFNPAVQALKKAVRKGRFGTMALCEAQIKWYRNQDYYDSGAWRGTKALDGGGALMNQSIHTIDLLLYFCGDVKRVSASTACLTHKNIEVEDTAVAILEMENGARGVIQGSTSCWSASGHPAEIHICGDRGSVFMADESFRVWDFMNPEEDDEVVKEHMMTGYSPGLGANDPKAINTAGHEKNFADVIHALETGSQPMVTGKEAMRSVKLINAIYASAKENGKWVEV